jgi:hypothetical protein
MVGYAIDAIRRFAGCDVRVRLIDGSAFSGRLRTELLSDHSQIAEIVLTDTPR